MVVDPTLSVFSLECYVIGAILRPGVSLLRRPSVIMRLLEFPAVVIDCPSKDDVADRLADRNLAWGLGKNCLFSVPERSLSSMLSRAPMYIMLVDLDDNGLQGTAAVDLSGYADGPAIVGKRGFRRGRVPLVDLMGNRVAFIDIVLRLSCLGSALLPHLEGFTVHRPADPPVDTAAVQQTIPIVQHDEPGRRNVADSCCLGQPPRLEPGETEEIVVPHEPEGPPLQEQQQAEPGRDVTVDGVEPIQEDDDPPALFFCHGTDADGQMEAQQASTLPEPTSAVEPSPPVRPVKRLDRKTTQGQNVATPFAGASSSRTKRIVPPLRPTRRRTLPTQSGVTNLREKANNGNRRSASLKSTRRTRRSRSPPKRRGPAPARPAAVHAALDSNAAIASALREIALQLSRRRPSLTGLPENDDVVGQQVILKEERLEPAVVPPVVHVTVTRPAATIEVVNASVSTEETTDAEESSSPAQNEKPCDAGPNPSSAEQQQQQQVAVDTGPSIETLMHERECSTSHQPASVVEAVAGGPVHDDKCPVEVSRMLETSEPESVEHISARMSMTDACTTLHADDNDKAVPEAGVAKDLLANVPASDDADDDYAADEFDSFESDSELVFDLT